MSKQKKKAQKITRGCLKFGLGLIQMGVWHIGDNAHLFEQIQLTAIDGTQYRVSSRGGKITITPIVP